jgi:hypothetical protein
MGSQRTGSSVTDAQRQRAIDAFSGGGDGGSAGSTGGGRSNTVRRPRVNRLGTSKTTVAPRRGGKSGGSGSGGGGAGPGGGGSPSLPVGRGNKRGDRHREEVDGETMTAETEDSSEYGEDEEREEVEMQGEEASSEKRHQK